MFSLLIWMLPLLDFLVPVTTSVQNWGRGKREFVYGLPKIPTERKNLFQQSDEINAFDFGDKMMQMSYFTLR